MAKATTGRRGRPRAGEREAREQAVLDAALAELVENGPEAMTMLAVARRAGASKETLYSWFGNREGLLRALIERNADQSAARIQAALDAAIDDESDPVETLAGYARGLLGLLTSPPSLALNRAAMGDPDLAALLLASGRHRVGPLVETYLSRLAGAGRLRLSVPADEAFALLYGLTVQDLQIRALLGDDLPTADELTARATVAVERFVRLVA